MKKYNSIKIERANNGFVAYNEGVSSGFLTDSKRATNVHVFNDVKHLIVYLRGAVSELKSDEELEEIEIQLRKEADEEDEDE